MQERILILLSCSRDKRQGGGSFQTSTRSIADPKVLPHNSGALLAQRRRVFDLLKGAEGRLYNDDQSAGFRDLRRDNQELELGPDFGDWAQVGHAYMPAFERYDGRFFSELRRIAPQFWADLPQHPVEICFVSGLYGLLFWDEAIQRYDCHMGDQVVGGHQDCVLGAHWRRVLTEALCEFIKRQNEMNRPVSKVFDLLSEDVYRDVFDWNRVRERPGVRVLHRNLKTIVGPDALPFLAQVLGTRLSRFYEPEAAFVSDGLYSLSSDTGEKFEFSFEQEFKSDLDKAFANILAQFPKLSLLQEGLAKELAAAEQSWLATGMIKNIDMGIFTVAFSKCFENWLRRYLSKWEPARRWSTWADAISLIRANPYLRELANDFRELKDLRNKAAHYGEHSTVTSVKRARYLVLSLISRGIEIEAHRFEK